MTIFKNKKTGKLYTISQGCRWDKNYFALPYAHFEPAPVRGRQSTNSLERRVKLDDFDQVAYR